MGGNYKTGVAFGDCVQYGFDVAKAAEAYLQKSKSTSSLSESSKNLAEAEQKITADIKELSNVWINGVLLLIRLLLNF